MVARFYGAPSVMCLLKTDFGGYHKWGTLGGYAERRCATGKGQKVPGQSTPPKKLDTFKSSIRELNFLTHAKGPAVTGRSNLQN